MIPLGVFKHLASLTTRTEELEIKWIGKLYPLHASTLRSTKLMHEEFPTLGEVLYKIATQDGLMEEGKEERKGMNQDK